MLFSWLKNLQWLLMIKKVKPFSSMINKAFFDLFLLASVSSSPLTLCWCFVTQGTWSCPVYPTTSCYCSWLVSSPSCLTASAQVSSLASSDWVRGLCVPLSYFIEIVCAWPISSAHLWSPCAQGLCFLQLCILRTLFNTKCLRGIH